MKTIVLATGAALQAAVAQLDSKTAAAPAGRRIDKVA